jgi:hypothetical protein
MMGRDLSNDQSYHDQLSSKALSVAIAPLVDDSDEPERRIPASGILERPAVAN